jgi:putative SbcD/Mre11-related phosphoesterase
MKFSDMQPISNNPVLYIKKDKILIIADLHIGIEKQLHELGVNAFSQTNIMKDKIISLCKKYNPNKIFLLGDIKHNIPSSTFQERKDVKDFLENLQLYGEIHIIPGNHDGNIKKLSPKDIIIHPSDGFLHKNIGLVHGHRWPSSDLMYCNNLIFGHTHPTIMLEDRLGYKKFESCWLKGEINQNKLNDRYPNSKKIKFVVIPAFNPLCGGIAANVDGLVGPISKIIDMDNTEVFLLDGSSLGRIKEFNKKKV